MTFPVSTVPNAIGQILTLAGSAVPTDTLVVYGSPREYEAANVVLVTGWQTVETPASLADYPSFQLEEVYEVEGMIRCYQGDLNQTATMTSATGIKTALQSAIRSDPTLAGNVRAAWWSSEVGRTGITDRGGVATEIEFSIHCEARISH